MRGASNGKAVSASGGLAGDQMRQVLVAKLRARRAEIEEAANNQVAAIPGLKPISDPEYTEGLRAAIAAAVEFGLTVVEHDEREIHLIPTALLAQARLAARNGLELSTVQERYVAGFALLEDFIVEEVSGPEIASIGVGAVLRCQRRAFQGLLRAVGEEYRREIASRRRSREERLAARIERLLDGEPVDISDLPYGFDGEHLGAFASGGGAQKAIRSLARALDCVPFTIPRPDDVVWAWLGSRGTSRAAVEAAISTVWPSDIPLSLGEPASGKRGFCSTHRQAQAAFPIACRLGRPTRYAEVALEATLSQNNLLLASLTALYLDPLACHRDGGEKARETLRAFLEANHSVAAAADKLGVHRHTVKNRIDTFEELIGQSLDVCGEPVRFALRLEGLGYMKN